MKLVTEVNIQQRVTAEHNLPYMARKNMVLTSIQIMEHDGENTVPAKNIVCKLGNTLVLGEAYFQTNEDPYDLGPHMNEIKNLSKYRLVITNKDNKTKRLEVVSTYEPSYGAVLIDESVTSFDRIMTEVSKFRCTKMEMSFNVPVKEVSFCTLATSEDPGWLESFGLEISDDVGEIYEIDFTKELAEYSEYLDLLQVRVEAKGENANVKAYVRAWGFKK